QHGGTEVKSSATKNSPQNQLPPAGAEFAAKSRRGNFTEGAVLQHGGTEVKSSATKNSPQNRLRQNRQKKAPALFTVRGLF
ncbi:MAG TPA: hypothetical protein PLP17_00260, partial [Oligoflexia bacterium]|nr:hypothetical protein [Oligoflexia bacterium]